MLGNQVKLFQCHLRMSMVMIFIRDLFSRETH